MIANRPTRADGDRAGSEPDPSAGFPRGPWILLIALVTGFWLWQSLSAGKSHPSVDYSRFYAWLEAGKVQRAILRGQALEGHLASPETVADKPVQDFQTTLPERDDALLPKLRERNVELRIEETRQPVLLQFLFSILPWILIIAFWFWISRRAQRALGAGPGALAGFLKSPSRKFERSAAVGVTFDDVAGLKAAKRDLREVVDFLKAPDRFRALGARVPRGILLVGPPGTGKTLLARAVAGESGVAFYSISASEFIEMFVGLGAARVRDLFQEAKKNAPSIVFIDEIDAVGRTRGAGFGGSHDEREQTLNQLLSEMDGFDRNDEVIVLAATNRPDVLDSALLRPGRFDRRVIVERPELAARRAILEVHSKGKPLDPDVDLDGVAKNTPGFSGAELANLVNEAALLASRREGSTITAKDFAEAYDKIVLGDPTEAKLDADEKRRVAVHEAGHAVASCYTPEVEPVRRVSILPRGLTLGATEQVAPPTDRHVFPKPRLESRLTVLMGGYAAEQEILGSVSSGAENDLREATDLAFRMVAHFGMSERLGPIYHEHRTEHPFLGHRIAVEGGTSDATVHVIESEAQRLLGEALGRATSTVREHRKDIDRLVSALLDRETLESEELARLLPEEKKDGERAPASRVVHLRPGN